MPNIALISDNHSYFGEDIKEAVEGCDEIWHVGDIGNPESIKYFEENFVFRAVFGNIDGKEIRVQYPQFNSFEIEGVKVLMTHIGGYPGRYYKKSIEMITKHNPDLFISGHSHILKVMRDKKNNLLHMNPGAYGFHGFHHMRTFLKFEIKEKKIRNVAAVELGFRGKLK